MAADGLSILWKELLHVSPFALIPRCLDKLGEEEATAVLIAQLGQTRFGFPQLLRNLVDLPVLLPPVQSIIMGLNHPLVMDGHLPLATWPISGDTTAQQDF